MRADGGDARTTTCALRGGVARGAVAGTFVAAPVESWGATSPADDRPIAYAPSATVAPSTAAAAISQTLYRRGVSGGDNDSGGAKRAGGDKSAGGDKKAAADGNAGGGSAGVDRST